jgi:hypothetical protein
MGGFIRRRSLILTYGMTESDQNSLKRPLTTPLVQIAKRPQ